MNRTQGKNEKNGEAMILPFLWQCGFVKRYWKYHRSESDFRPKKQTPCSPSSLCSTSGFNKAGSFDSHEKISHEMKLLAKDLKQKLIPFISAVKFCGEQPGSKFCWTLGPDPAKPYSWLSSIAAQARNGRDCRIQLPFSEHLHPAESLLVGYISECTFHHAACTKSVFTNLISLHKATVGWYF